MNYFTQQTLPEETGKKLTLISGVVKVVTKNRGF